MGLHKHVHHTVQRPKRAPPNIPLLFSSQSPTTLGDFENDSQMQQLRLEQAKPGCFLRLTAIEANTDPHANRLADLGLVEGACLEIIYNASASMPMILEVNGTKLCIDRSLARNFWVSREVAR